MKLTYKQYKFISEIIWGCVPIDRIWAEQTNIFQSKYKEILRRYPLLDKSI